MSVAYFPNCKTTSNRQYHSNKLAEERFDSHNAWNLDAIQETLDLRNSTSCCHGLHNPTFDCSHHRHQCPVSTDKKPESTQFKPLPDPYLYWSDPYHDPDHHRKTLHVLEHSFWCCCSNRNERTLLLRISVYAVSVDVLTHAVDLHKTASLSGL